MPTITERPVIGFLTDFGFDGAAATCRAVMLSVCRDAQIVDISHAVRKFAVADGAFLLRAALPYFPVGVHVGVVDPGVGTPRRPVAIRTARGDVLIGPDNGLLLPAADALGGASEARELTNRDLWLPGTSATFHGRDIFAPVAARLAAGTATFDEVGPPVPLSELVRLPVARPRVEAGRLATTVTYVDSFGNLRLGGGRGELEKAFAGIDVGTRLRVGIGEVATSVVFAPSFGHVEQGAALLYVDSTGDLALAENQGSLADRVAATVGTRVEIRPG
ncbi:MAG TPA: SAM-dependent chlorinase/fluorinase [Candidatus Limnocylindria bacterium]|nr:SAM-dependent chlorinase/fluorinase [Candidatus Limnocylindria bacterium]